MHTIVDKIFKTSSPNGVTLESKTVHTPPLHSKLGSSVIFYNNNRGTTNTRRGGGGKALHVFSPF